MSIKNRYEFALLVSVKNGNINGDPNRDGAPRQDPYSKLGLISSCCFNRKVRDYIIKKYPNKGIFFQSGHILDDLIEEPYSTIPAVKDAFEAMKNGDKKANPVELAKAALCEKYYDIRTFGAVLSTGDAEAAEAVEGETVEEGSSKKKNGRKFRKTAGQVRGPVQTQWGESLDPIIYVGQEAVTRGCVTNEKEAHKERTMGSKYRIPFALYRIHVYVSANDAAKTAFSDEDIQILKEAYMHMFEEDRSSSRGEVVVRKAFCFKHESAYGNAPSHELLERIAVKKAEGVSTPASFQDYVVTVDDKCLPAGVTMEELKW